ncbi:hypothetical protein SS37A_13080 [Methylocystis iwaonis]|uniref:Uncharacterized protein n=1 Tax=Methylocystis iwaonis TaxID=2885079 RepID=A0ABM8E744_9HYPH|nr:hypothetical protein SS37A_13080 [Methylocystis iwaonis]
MRRKKRQIFAVQRMQPQRGRILEQIHGHAIPPSPGYGETGEDAQAQANVVKVLIELAQTGRNATAAAARPQWRVVYDFAP